MLSNHGTQSPETIPEGYLWLGQVGRPHGVRGAFFLKTEDNRSEWPGYEKIRLKTSAADKILQVEKAYLSGGKLAIQTRELTNREMCEGLYNAYLFVARESIHTTADEYVVADLLGCRVEVEGRSGVYGSVIAVHNFGAQETLEIQKSESQDTLYFPFIDDFIVEVRETDRLIIVKDESAFLDEQKS